MITSAAYQSLARIDDVSANIRVVSQAAQHPTYAVVQLVVTYCPDRPTMMLFPGAASWN